MSFEEIQKLNDIAFQKKRLFIAYGDDWYWYCQKQPNQKFGPYPSFLEVLKASTKDDTFCPFCGSQEITKSVAVWSTISNDDHENFCLLDEHQCGDCGSSFWTGNDDLPCFMVKYRRDGEIRQVYIPRSLLDANSNYSTTQVHEAFRLLTHLSSNNIIEFDLNTPYDSMGLPL